MYEECSTTENDGGFVYNFIKAVLIFGFSTVLASFFVAEHVWKPMFLTEQEIKEIEEELENKNIPYEDRYTLTSDTEYEFNSESESESESSSESESEPSSESKSSSESKCVQEEKSEENELSEEGEVKTSDEDSDEISSGELVEKPSDSESEINNENEEKINKELQISATNEVANEIVEETLDEAIKNLQEKKQKKKIVKINKKKWQEKKESLRDVKIIEHTPLGNVLMYYDHNTETFCYYGPKNIPFKYLETVARKYVKVYDCKPLYVNTKKEIENAEKIMKEKQEAEKTKQEAEKMSKEDKKETQEKEEESVFANFKNYKRDGIQSETKKDSEVENIKKLVGNTNQKTIIQTIPQEKKEKKCLVVPEKSNRFTYKGKLDSSEFLKIKKKEIKLDFSEFKKMMANKQKKE